MRIASNKISDVARFFHSELGSIYPKSEVDVFVAVSFEEILGLSKAQLLLKKDEAMSESEMLRFTAVIKQLKSHRPIHYIFGKADFCGMKLEVNENVLIPRPETEELVEWIKDDAKTPSSITPVIPGVAEEHQPSTINHQPSSINHHPSSIIHHPSSILDIGTGSGCIAIALKKYFTTTIVSALDVSAKALEVAKRNAENNSAAINFIHADILHRTQNPSPGKFDVIVSNPPYVRMSEKEMMQKNVLDHEPHLALFVSDEDALVFYKAIVSFAKEHLHAGGKLYFEVNEALGTPVKELMVENGFGNVELKKDLSGKERMLRGILF